MKIEFSSDFSANEMWPKKCKKEKWNEYTKYTCRSKQKCDFYFLHTRNRNCKMWEETFSYLGSWHKLYKLSRLWEMPPSGNKVQTQTQRAFPEFKGSGQRLRAGAPWGSLGQGAQALDFFILLIFAKCIDVGEQDLCDTWHVLTCQSTVITYST